MNAWDSLVGVLARQRLPVLVVGALLVAGGVASAPGLRISTEASDVLPRVSPRVAAWIDLSNRFGGFQTLIVGLEEPSQPFTASGLAAVKRITDDLAARKSDGLRTVTSVTNVDSITEGEDGSVQTERLITSIPQDAAGLAALAKRVAADRQVSGALVSRDQRAYQILVAVDPRSNLAQVASQVRTIVEAGKGTLSANYFGAPFFSATVTRAFAKRGVILGASFAILLLLVLAVRIRRPSVIALVLISDALSLAVWAGVVRVIGAEVSFASLTALLVVAVLGAVVFARGLDRAAPTRSPLPWALVATLSGVAISGYAVSRIPIVFLASCGVVILAGTVAILLVGLFVFVPLASWLGPAPAPRESPRRPWLIGVALGVTVLIAGGAAASRTRYQVAPQTMFAGHDEAGQWLAFFDRRFGGPDFVQVDFTGDLREPAIAARLMRFTDLLEGSKDFSDVRSVTQVLGFLSHGFVGVHRMPTTREELKSLWFFVEGRPEVRNLASDKRDEAMVALRVPLVAAEPMERVAAVVEAAASDSLKTGPDSTRLRLAAVASAFGVTLDPTRVEASLGPLPKEDADAVDQAARTRLREWIASPESPYQPPDDERDKLEAALQGARQDPALRVQLASLTLAGLPDAEDLHRFVGAAAEHDHGARINLEAEHRMAALLLGLPSLPEAFRQRVTGILADRIDPQPVDGGAATIVVSGLPVIGPQMQSDLLAGLWRALALVIGITALAALVLTLRPGVALRMLLESAVATALAVAICGTLGPGLDSASMPLLLLVPLASSALSGQPSGSVAVSFLAALGVAGAALFFVDAEPVTRMALVMLFGTASVMAVNAVSRQFGAPLNAPAAG